MRKSDYFKYLGSESWKERKKELLKEAEYICDECGGKATLIHHLDYKNQMGVPHPALLET